MNPRRKHDRAVFYKYMDAKTAKAVLRSRSLRWSSPLRFNDPFDVPRELAVGLSSDAIFEGVCHAWIELIRNPPETYERLNPSVAFALEMAKTANRLELINGLVAALATGDFKRDRSKQEANLELVRQMWRETLPQFRILCMCASYEKTSMWYHYADKYSGAVIELACRDDLDSPWLGAQPVQYPVNPPEIFQPAGWGRLLTLKTELVVEEMLRAYTYNKTPDWSYEEEWRVFTFRREGETDDYFDYRIDPRNFAKVFLGPLISDEDRLQILSFLTDDLANVVPLQAKFELDRRFSFSPLAIQ